MDLLLKPNAICYESYAPSLFYHDKSVQIYCIDISVLPGEIEKIRILDQNELKKADKFIFPADKKRYLYSRIILRFLISKYLSLEPGLIKICTNEHGKPYVAPEQNKLGLQFNISHCFDKIYFLFTKKIQAGIDLEDLNREVNYMGIAKRFYHPLEYTQLIKTEKLKQKLRFFIIWVCKEAYVKALGKGLLYDFDSFCVQFRQTDAGLFAGINQNDVADNFWTIYPYINGSDIVAVAMNKNIVLDDIHFINMDRGTLIAENDLR